MSRSWKGRFFYGKPQWKVSCSFWGRETIDDEEKVGVENNEWARWHKGKGGVRAWPGPPYSCIGTIPQKEVLLYTHTMNADCTDYTSITMTTNNATATNTFATTRYPLLLPLLLLLLPKPMLWHDRGLPTLWYFLPPPASRPQLVPRQAGYPGAGREGYWATHQNTGACCWHGSLKCMEGDHETTEINTLTDKG